MANRYQQLTALIPKGSTYNASGVILPLRSSPYELLFAPVPASTTFDVFINDAASGSVTSNGDGEAVVTARLTAGFNEIVLVQQGSTATFPAYVTTRTTATLHAAHAEVFERLDGDIEEMRLSTALETATSKYIEDVFGKPLLQPNDMNWVTGTYRKLLRWLRQAFRLFGSKLLGIRQGVAAYTASMPLRVPRAWRAWWRTGYDLVVDGAFTMYARLTASPLTNLNARSVDYVHAAYAATAPNVFAGPITDPPAPERLRIRFAVGWDGGDVTITGVDDTGAVASEVVTPVAAQPLVAVEDVDTDISFASISMIEKSVIGTGGTAAVGLRDSRFIELVDIGDYNPVGAALLEYLTGPDRLRWLGASSSAVAIPTSGRYTLRDVDSPAWFFGLVPEPGGGYVTGVDQFLSIEGNGLGRVLIDLSNDAFNAGPGFSGGASPRTQAQVATTASAYFARDLRYGALPAVGDITCVDGPTIAAADVGNTGTFTVTIDDGLNPALTFQFFRAPTTTAGVGNIIVFYSSIDTVDQVALKLAAAINTGWNDVLATTDPSAIGALRVYATANTTISGQVDLVTDFGGAQGNNALVLSGAASGAGFSVTGLAGGANSGYAAYASAVTSFSNALRLGLVSGAAPFGEASSVIVHPVGAEATQVVLGVPRARSTLAALAAARDVVLNLPSGHRLPLVSETIVLQAAFGDTVVSISSSFSQPDRVQALEIYFSAAWRTSAVLRVAGTAANGATQTEVFTPVDSGVDEGATASSTDGVTITLGGGETFDGVEAGMFFRRTTDSEGAYIKYVQSSTQIVVASAISGSPWGPVAWEVTRDQVVKGTLAFASVSQIDNLSVAGAGTGGEATLMVIDADTRGYEVRVGRGLRDSGAGGAGVDVFPVLGVDATFVATGAFEAQLADVGGYLHIRGATLGSTANVGLHAITEVTVGTDTLRVRHQDAGNGREFVSETLPGGASWRIFSAGEVVRVVAYDTATGDLTLYPSGLRYDWALGAPVELVSEVPTRTYGVDGLRTLTVDVDTNLLPTGATSDSLTLAGTGVPDGWRAYNMTSTGIDWPGWFRSARLQLVAVGADADGIGTTDMTLERDLRPEDVVTYRGFTIRMSFWGQAHATGGGTFQLEASINGAAFAALTPITGSTVSNPQAVARTMANGIGAFGSGALDPQLVQGEVELPFDAATVRLRIRFVGAGVGHPFSLEQCVVVATPSMGLYLGSSTTPLSEKRAKFGEVLYVWSPDALNDAENRGLGMPAPPASQPDNDGTIDRITNAHGLWDRYDVSEYDSLGDAVNVRGDYFDIDWLAATLTNLDIVAETPSRMSCLRPSNVSLVEETLSIVAPSNATLAETSAHEGPYPEESFDDELLLEDGLPVPAEPQVIRVTGTGDSISAPVGGYQTLTDAAAAFTADMTGRSITIRGSSALNNGTFTAEYLTATTCRYPNPTGVVDGAYAGTYEYNTLGVLPWRFTAATGVQIASVAAGDPADEAVFNAAATYTLQYRRLTRVEGQVIDLGASFADYLWLVDAAIYLRREPGSSSFERTQELTFQANYRATLTVVADVAASNVALIRDDGVTRETLARASWAFVDQTTVSINSSVFDPNSIYSLEYTALLPAYPAPATYVVEIRSSNVSAAAVLAAAWREAHLDELVNQAHRYHQLRVTVSGIVDTRDIQINGLGLRGLHLYGASPYAPGIL